MSNSTRYFQLTPNILVEYSYNNVLNSSNQVTSSVTVDLINDCRLIGNAFNATKTVLYNPVLNKFVQPVNMSESKFVQCKKDNSLIWNNSTDFKCISFTEPSGNDDLKNKILVDTFKLHFTGRNYFGDYDGLIISAYIYDKIKNKIGLLSQYISRTDDVNLNDNPTLINQKLYTTYLDFTLPSVSALSKSDVLPSEGELKNKLFSKYDMMDNTPIIMNIFGVKSIYENNSQTYFNVEKINSIYIPIEDNTHNLEIRVEEANDGDYFQIYPIVDGGSVSFSDYIYNISGERPETYIVFHEITLTEYYVDNTNTPQHKVTHREQYIINAAQHSDEENEKYKTNEDELDDIMYYRPILKYSGRIVNFIIDVKTNIINTLDNTTIIKKTSLNYSPQNGYNPKKYGKKMNKIYLGEIPAQVNVYNKKPDIDVDGVKITNASSNVKIENHQHSVIGFIECANVGVSIEQVPKEVLQ